jgi:predicted molibdopterin-dependent oxidoreductase YjgC
MLVRVNDRPLRPIMITIDSAPFEAKAGDSVAAALMDSGALASRLSAVSASPRGAYCLMGVCFECLVTIDGVANRQGCLVEVREGMAVETHGAQREAHR